MSPWLLLILIIMGNLVIYWLFFGKRKFEEKLKMAQKHDVVSDQKEKKV